MRRTGGLTVLRPGAYLVGTLPDDVAAQHTLQVHTALEHLAEDAVVSHVSAALLHGLPTWGVSLERVHVSRARSRSGGRVGRRVHVHCVPRNADEVVAVGGLTVTSVGAGLSTWRGRCRSSRRSSSPMPRWRPGSSSGPNWRMRRSGLPAGGAARPRVARGRAAWRGTRRRALVVGRSEPLRVGGRPAAAELPDSVTATGTTPTTVPVRGWNVHLECAVGVTVARRRSPSGNATVSELLAARRAGAELRVESLQRQVDAIVESSSLTANDDEHDPEGATIAFERAQLLTLLAQARADLDDLDRAADRLHHGTYHRCERCGQPIGEQRLAALPATRTCIRCTTAR